MRDFDRVGAFHEKFKLDNVTYRTGAPHLELKPGLQEFRIKFLEEELQELKEGYEERNLEKVADALVDLVYVALGTAHLHGLPWSELFRIVHSSNMKKVRAQRAEQSARGSVFDVVKPKGWKPPNIRAVLKKAGWRG